MSIADLPRRLANRLRGLFLLPEVLAGLDNVQRLMSERLGESVELQRAQLVMQRDQVDAIERLILAVRESSATAKDSVGFEDSSRPSGTHPALKS